MKRNRFGSSTLSLTIMLFTFIVFTSIANADTLFYYTSSPSSYIGGGETVTVTPSDGFDFDISGNPDQGVSFWISDLDNNPDYWAHRWWFLDFAGPMDQPLQVGHYGNATRYPLQDVSEPGLAFGGNGRSNSELTGYFDVLEVNYDGSGNVLVFAADFMQYDENNQDWWNRGSVRYNSTMPVTVVPEPFSPYDTNQDWIIGDFELLNAIDDWAVGNMDDFDLLDLIDYWAAGCYQWDSLNNQYKSGCSGLLITEPINISVSPDLYSQYESISIDEAGAINVSWLDNSGILLFSKSTDGGYFFTSPVIADKRPSPYLSYRYVDSVSKSGYIHVTWTYYTTDGHADIFYSQSTDGGNTFSEPLIISNIDGINSYAPSIAAEGNLVGVFWHNSGIGSIPSHISFTISEDYGKTFFPPMIFSDSFGCPELAIRSKNIYILWTKNNGPFDADIYFSKLDYYGQTISNPLKISGDLKQVWCPVISIDDVGNIYAVWTSDRVSKTKILFVRSTNGGETFTSPLVISAPEEKSFAPSITSIGDGFIYITWMIRNLDGSQRSFITASHNKGVAFSNPIIIPIDMDTKVTAVATHPNQIGIVWHDYPPDNPNKAEIYYSNIKMSPIFR